MEFENFPALGKCQPLQSTPCIQQIALRTDCKTAYYRTMSEIPPLLCGLDIWLRADGTWKDGFNIQHPEPSTVKKSTETLSKNSEEIAKETLFPLFCKMSQWFHALTQQVRKEEAILIKLTCATSRRSCKHQDTSRRIRSFLLKVCKSIQEYSSQISQVPIHPFFPKIQQFFYVPGNCRVTFTSIFFVPFFFFF